MQTDIARLTIDLPIALHRILKAHAVLNNSNVKEFVIDAIHTRLAKETDIGNKLNAQTKEVLRKSKAEKRKIYNNVDEFMKSVQKKKK
ncbi:MAG: hypothetical protein EXR06_01125 [Rickettsiales bacterium]|nr:hypothetical protein [Rickettsiales bacterium]